MQNTDEQIRKMLELKETIIEKMSKYQDEIDFLQKNLEVLDVILKGFLVAGGFAFVTLTFAVLSARTATEKS